MDEGRGRELFCIEYRASFADKLERSVIFCHSIYLAGFSS